MHLNEQRAKETQPFHANGVSLIKPATLLHFINNISISSVQWYQHSALWALVNAWNVRKKSLDHRT